MPTISEQLRAMSYNPYSHPSPKLCEVMQKAADELDRKEFAAPVVMPKKSFQPFKKLLSFFQIIIHRI